MDWERFKKDVFDRVALRRMVLLYAIPVVLVVVACGQNALVRTHGLTQWKGGGFGMFSTVDSRGTRFLRVFLVTKAGKEIEVNMPNRMSRTRESVRSHPHSGNIDGLAAQLMATPWILKDEPITDLNPPQNALRLSETMKPSALNRSQPECSPEGSREYRLLRPSEVVPSDIPTLSPALIRIELWSYDFSQEDMYLNARLVSERTYDAG